MVHPTTYAARDASSAALRRESDLKFLSKSPIIFFRTRPRRKSFAILMLEKLTAELVTQNINRLESWLKRISSWADHRARCILDRAHDLSRPERLTPSSAGEVARTLPRAAWP